MRTFSVNVFRWTLGDCTNEGVSSKHDTLTVLAEGEPLPKNPPPDLFIEQHRGGEYWALIPATRPANLSGPMFGGNLATTSNGVNNRHTDRIWHIHDRFETDQMARLNSD